MLAALLSLEKSLGTCLNQPEHCPRGDELDAVRVKYFCWYQKEVITILHQKG